MIQFHFLGDCPGHEVELGPRGSLLRIRRINSQPRNGLRRCSARCTPQPTFPIRNQ